jgi:hypothetical protein
MDGSRAKGVSIVANKSTHSFGVSDIGEIASELQAIDHLCASGGVALDSKRQDTAKLILAELLHCHCMVRMIRETWVIYPPAVSEVEVLTHDT